AEGRPCPAVPLLTCSRQPTLPTRCDHDGCAAPMHRLTNNRVFIGILLMVLQLAFLPNARRCSGSRLSGGSCCCTAVAGNSDVNSQPEVGNQQDRNSRSAHGSCCSKHADSSE